jgi:ABC-type antimicrobial peptide transport system permease subunit
MLEQLGFYLRHSLNDLRVNGRRTFFALLCIAAGVAAIVSLQTLAVMIGDTLSGNLQASNRGDIQLQLLQNFGGNDELLQQGVEDGLLQSEEQGFLGNSQVDYTVTQDGIARLQSWIDENYPGQIELTYPYALSDEFAIFTGGGVGGAINAVEQGTSASSLLARVIDPDLYPFYSEVQTVEGVALRDALQSPNDILLQDKVADALGVQVGDVVRVNGSSADFSVRGIVTAEAEVRDINTGFFISLGGFYYLSHDALPLFEDVAPKIETIYLRLSDPSEVDAINAAIASEFPYFSSVTTTELREQNEQLATSINQLVTIMGLVSLLIGSIGIVNTMQVIVQRRTVEIAVLKTLGLQASQVTVLFLVEAFIMGVIGSLLGILLGWATTFVIKSAAETLVAQPLAFRIALQPVVSGLVVGVLVTTIFGLLPTLSAGQVRPGVVLRPNEDIVPRAGRGRSLLALLLIIVALTLVAQTIIGDFGIAFGVVIGTFVVAGIIYVLLTWLITLVGRLFAAFGLIDLKISMRQMLVTKRRNAITLLALVAGVFSLSVITLYAQSINSLLESVLTSSGDVFVAATSEDQLTEVVSTLDELEGVEDYRVTRTYSGEFVSLQRANGETVSREQMIEIYRERAEQAAEIAAQFGAEFEEGNLAEEIVDQLGSISGLEADALPQDTFVSGRQVNGEGTLPEIVLRNDNDLQNAGIGVGDQITLGFTPVVFGREVGEGVEVTFEVVGIAADSLVSGGFSAARNYTLYDMIPDEISPSSQQVLVDISDEALPELRRQLSDVPGTFVLETDTLNQIITSLLGTFSAFPTMVAALGLIVGGVVIANSVALSMLERRRQIAIMKSVGLQRERVLGMLLLENGILGLIGGLIGVGIGFIILTLNLSLAGGASGAIPYGTAFLLMLLCVGVALVAAMTSVWSASGEKPLNVLRYE